MAPATGMPMSTLIIFGCPQCSAIYRATQRRLDERAQGSFVAEIAVRLFILGMNNTRTPAFNFSSQMPEDPLTSEFKCSIARGAHISRA